MGANEEYLDNLLKSVTNGLTENESVPEDTIVITEPETMDSQEDMSSQENTGSLETENSLEEMFDLDAMLRELTSAEEMPPENETGEESDNGLNESIDSKEFENLFAGLNEESNSEGNLEGQIFSDDIANFSEEDISRMLELSQENASDFGVPEEIPEISGFLETDPNVEAINSLLEKADNNEVIDPDALAMFAAAGVASEPEEPVDIWGEIQKEETKKNNDKGSAKLEKAAAREQKKAEKERKRKEKEAKRAEAKAAKAASKQNKRQMAEAEDEESLSFEPDEADSFDMGALVSQQSDLSQEESVGTAFPQSEESSFDSYQEVEGFDDIEALLGSLNLEELDLAAELENNNSEAGNSVTDMSSVNDSTVSSTDSGREANDDLFAGLFADEDSISGIEALESSVEVRDLVDVKASGAVNGDVKEKDAKEKKPGAFKRFMNFLLEEDEEEEEEIKEKPDKKDKKSKGKKGKNEGSEEEELDEIREKKSDKKAKKEKKPKKEKKQKSEFESKYKSIDEPGSGKKVGKTGVMVAVLLAASVFAVVYLGNIVFSPLLAKQRAQKAFNAQDYEQCYQELAGWQLSEKEENMRKYAAVVLKMDRRIDAYEQYTGLRKKLDALDSLMKAVANYEELYQEALNCGAQDEVEARYDVIVGLLDEEYNLSEKEAKAIASLKSDVEYTRYLTAVIEGRVLSGLDDGEEELPGLLPEEEELPDTEFAN